MAIAGKGGGHKQALKILCLAVKNSSTIRGLVRQLRFRS